MYCQYHRNLEFLFRSTHSMRGEKLMEQSKKRSVLRFTKDHFEQIEDIVAVEYPCYD